MGLSLRNTLTGEVEAFEPTEHDRVTLYYCGLTVSDRAHLGHARSWVHVDVLRRWLEHRGYDVRHVENFTDVNEKIVARVGERDGWDDERAVAEHFIDRTLADMRRLNLRRAYVYPRVSDHVEEIIDLTQRLVDAGHAYEVDGSVYFDVPSFEGYGQLAPPPEDHQETPPDKRHPADFALWKAGGVDVDDLEDHVKDPDLDLEAAREGARTWSSPWGEGRPGWHIECSAMSTTHLGETFDVHVAGRDIVFPHNENEIAQAEAASNEPYARYWVHVDLLAFDDAKMSSSLGNFLTVEAAVERFGADAVRTFLLSANHGTRQAYSEEAIEEATDRVGRLRRAYDRASEVVDSTAASARAGHESLRWAVDDAREAAREALDDDLDTRGALVALEGLASTVLAHVEERHPPYDYVGLVGAIEVLETVGGDVLGLTFDAGSADDAIDDLLEALLAYRESLRAAGAYDHADDLRAAIEGAGIEIEDTDDGPRYRLAGGPESP